MTQYTVQLYHVANTMVHQGYADLDLASIQFGAFIKRIVKEHLLETLPVTEGNLTVSCEVIFNHDGAELLPEISMSDDQGDITADDITTAINEVLNTSFITFTDSLEARDLVKLA
jgi:hypothetical protein